LVGDRSQRELLGVQVLVWAWIVPGGPGGVVGGAIMHACAES